VRERCFRRGMAGRDPDSRLCRHSAGKQSPFSSLLPALPVPAPRGEGRKEGEHPSRHGSRSEPGHKPTHPPGKEPASHSWEGKTNREPLLTRPNTALLARERLEAGLCKGFKPRFPSRGGGKLGSGAGRSHGGRWGPQ